MRFPWQRSSKPEVRQINFPFDVGPPPLLGGWDTSDTVALSFGAVYASVRLLADSVASLPLNVYRDVNDRPQRVRASSLFDQPAAYGTQYDWLYQLMTALLLHGNAYGLITARDGFGYPTNIEWLRTDLVHCQEDPGLNPMLCKWFYMGREVPRENLFHVRAFSLAGHI